MSKQAKNWLEMYMIATNEKIKAFAFKRFDAEVRKMWA